MSLYNQLFGTNPISDILLSVLNMNREDTGRFRDCFLNAKGDRILVYTRNGGGNRQHYDDSENAKQEGEHCDCTGCTMMYHLPSHPNYIKDWDDSYDSTYAIAEFSVPEAYKSMCGALATGTDPESIHEKFEQAMDKLRTDPKVCEKHKKILDPLVKAIEELGKGGGDGKPKIIKI